jgi:hypothetical protein
VQNSPLAGGTSPRFEVTEVLCVDHGVRAEGKEAMKHVFPNPAAVTHS